jgi:glutamyl-tRNA synthetase
MTAPPSTTRFAPSPTGDLHLGGAWTALASWALARGRGGRTVLRVEDLDPPRVVPGAAGRIARDLAWLGLEWDEGPVFQSARSAQYEATLARLDAAGLTYPCDCSRAEIARVASAPHAGEEGAETIYPGTCRDAPRARTFKRPPAIRLRVPDGARVTFDDLVAGRVEEDVRATAGDFVLRRGDGIFAYQLAVAVDDAEMNVTHVVRADDLLGSTARQLLLMQLVGHASTPAYAHVPLVVAPGGERLAKRTRGATIRELAARGIEPETIVGGLAHGLGLVPADAPARLTSAEVARVLTPPERWRRTPWPLPHEWA